MPSPFPGMDPYLEAHWRDVHPRLIVYACDALQVALPGSLRARVEERVVLETPEGFHDHSFFPDVRVVKYPWERGNGGRETAGGVATKPILVGVTPEPFTEGYIEIVDRASGNEVVTIIEFLSPTNKLPGDGRKQYLAKQAEILQSRTNLVEIDLNRLGGHVLAFPLEKLKPQYRTGYMASVRRPTRPEAAEVYLIPLSERLPTIQVPLRPDDADVPLDLQALVDQTYRNGAYDGTLNYATDPDPPLLGHNAAWADALLREKGLRDKPKPPRRGKRKKADD